MIGYIPCKGGSGAAPARLNETGAAPGSMAKKKGCSDLSGGEADRRRFGEDATPKGTANIRE